MKLPDLLRDVLAETGMVGIGKVAMRSRQHLAALKANGRLLVLELMPSDLAAAVTADPAGGVWTSCLGQRRFLPAMLPVFP